MCSLQSLGQVQFFLTPWTAAPQASLSITNSWSLLKLISIESMLPSKHLILCHPLLLLPSVFPRIWVFSNESVLHIRWTKYWSFSFSFSPVGLTGLISLQPRDSPESSPTPQFKNIHSLALSILDSPTLISIHDYWKNHSFDWMDFVDKVMSLLFNMLSRLVIAFLPRSKCFLISWLQSPSAMIFLFFLPSIYFYLCSLTKI